MGKKYKNLISKVTDIENMRDAYKKAAKGRNKYSCGHLAFKEHLEYNLYKLKESIENETYKVGQYYTFVVYEPKKRIISALPFRDRVVQHAINNIIEPIFDKTFYPCSYGCRKDKGVHNGTIAVQSTIRRESKENILYCLKMDFKKYFHNINSNVLKKEIAKKIKDRKLLELIYLFISENGIKIGNLLSQLFSNIYGNIYDKFIKTKLKIKNYFRYVDDSIILHTSKQYLIRVKNIIKKFIGIFLKLNFSHWGIEKVETKAINFLGYRIRNRTKLIRKSSITNAKRKIKKFLRYNDIEKLKSFMGSWNGHIMWSDCKMLKEKIKKENYIWNSQTLNQW